MTGASITITFSDGSTDTVTQPENDPPGSPFNRAIGAVCELIPDDEEEIPATAKVDELFGLFDQMAERGFDTRTALGIAGDEPSEMAREAMSAAETMTVDELRKLVTWLDEWKPDVVDTMIDRLRAALGSNVEEVTDDEPDQA